MSVKKNDSNCEITQTIVWTYNGNVTEDSVSIPCAEFEKVKFDGLTSERSFGGSHYKAQMGIHYDYFN